MDVTSIVIEKLRGAGIRPTRQRVALGTHLWKDEKTQHLTAEKLHQLALASDEPVSLATVYNTLHQFTEAGLLHEVVIDNHRSYFDTNIAPHHHFYFEDSGELCDIPAHMISMTSMMQTPDNAEVVSTDVVIRLRRKG